METTLASFDIKIVFDNAIGDNDFIAGFGFSALIYNYFTAICILVGTIATLGVSPNSLFNS